VVAASLPSRALAVTLGCGLTLAVAGCGSSHSSSSEDSGSPFGPRDAGHDVAKQPAKDAGVVHKDATTKGIDAGCGTRVGPDWCDTNAPALTTGSPVMCNDFDTGEISSLFGWMGVSKWSLVDTHYVSAYCALDVLVGDGGAPHPTQGSYTENPYTGAPGSGAATFAFDLLVPGGAACNGAVVGRFTANADGAVAGDALKGWLTISNIAGSGATATSYTLGLSLAVGTAGTPSAAVTVDVKPRSTDEGWARLGFDLSSYSFVTTSGAITGKATWGYRGETTTQGTSTAAATASGTLTTTTQTGVLLFDVGVLPDPTSKNAISGCELFVDDVVSNLPGT
jgi:hypothetical protein